LVVEDLDKFFEARLLLKKIGDGRLGGLFLQGQMHALEQEEIEALLGTANGHALRTGS